MGFLPRELLSVSCIFTIRTVHRSPFGHFIYSVAQGIYYHAGFSIAFPIRSLDSYSVA